MSWKVNKDILVLVSGLFIGLVVGAIVMISLNVEDLQVFTRDDHPVVGTSAPGFALNNLSDEVIRLSDFKGKPVIINFWATWCSPCRAEMPLLEKSAGEFDGSLIVLGVNLNDSKANIAKFVQEVGISFPVLRDEESQVAELYQVHGLPSTFFVDRQGMIKAVHIGVLSENQLNGYIEKIEVKE